MFILVVLLLKADDFAEEGESRMMKVPTSNQSSDPQDNTQTNSIKLVGKHSEKDYWRWLMDDYSQ